MNAAYQTALSLLNKGRVQEAQDLYRSLLVQDQQLKYVLNDLGVTFFMQGDMDRAIDYYRAALLVDPSMAIVYQNLGNARMQQGDVDQAIASYYRAMELSPDKTWIVQVGRQILTKLTELGRTADIKTYWETLLIRFPEDVGILHNYANHLQNSLYRSSEAIRIYERLEKTPGVDLPQLYNDWGVALKGQGQISEGLARYRQALALQPFMPVLFSNMLFDTLYDPDMEAGEILALHRQYETTQAFEGTVPFRHDLSCAQNRRPLRIGYLSSDFRYHSVGVFSLSAVVHHNRERFTVCCYYNCPDNDEYTQKFKEHADLWRVVDGLHPTAVARQIFEDKIDILVDLNGHTQGNLMPALLYKPAPVQISWIGYVHSLGFSTVNYFITDDIADPPGMTEGQFVERLLRLPGSFLCYTPYTNPPPVLDTPALANGFVTFGIIGNYFKMNPAMIALYAKAMYRVQGSRCLVKSGAMADEQLRERLLQQFESHGIQRDRMILRERTDEIDAYLSTYREIDVLFDFFPFNGETITCAALQMGTPVISLTGQTHRSRAGLSILTALGHPEWAADTEENFVEIAAALTSDFKRLNRAHLGLRNEFLASPLCDGPGFTRKLEAAYEATWKEACNNKGKTGGLKMTKQHRRHTGGGRYPEGRIS
jgi:protein O-GlcNAc transferase